MVPGDPTTAPAAHVVRPRNPRHDPDLASRLLGDLLAHRGEWRPLGRLYLPGQPSAERALVVRDAVALGRRHGLEIEGCRRRGYRFVRFVKSVRPRGGAS